MNAKNLFKPTFLILAAGSVAASLTFGATSAMAGKEVFVRTKPHVNVAKPAATGKFAAETPTVARKWCGPGGRLCIENGRWTWKKKKKK